MVKYNIETILNVIVKEPDVMLKKNKNLVKDTHRIAKKFLVLSYRSEI